MDLGRDPGHRSRFSDTIGNCEIRELRGVISSLSRAAIASDRALAEIYTSLSPSPGFGGLVMLNAGRKTSSFRNAALG